jgi:hypothetical protein
VLTPGVVPVAVRAKRFVVILAKDGAESCFSPRLIRSSDHSKHQLNLVVTGERTICAALLCEECRAFRRDSDAIILRSGASLLLRGDSASQEHRHPQTHSADVLAEVARTLAIWAGAVILIGHVEEIGLTARDCEKRATALGVTLLPLLMASEKSESLAIAAVSGRDFDGHRG